MDPQLVMLVPVVAGTVSAVRKHFPKVDGGVVLVITLLVSLLLAYQAKLETVVPAEVILGVKAALGAYGGVNLISYFIGKLPVALRGDEVVATASQSNEEKPS